MMRSLLRALFRIVEILLILGAIALMALTLALMSSEVTVSLGLTSWAMAITSHLPSWLALLGVLPAPTMLGGTFRTDFVLIAVAALVLARILHFIVKSLD